MFDLPGERLVVELDDVIGELAIVRVQARGVVDLD